MDGINPDLNKVQDIMDLRWPTTRTEVQALIGMFQYWRNIWTRRSKILAPLTEAAVRPKSRKYFGMVHYNSYLGTSSLLSLLRLYWIIQTRPFISQYTLMPLIKIWVLLSVRIINQLFFSKVLITPQSNYTTTKKELL